jgi:hypothetical protein
MMEGVLPQTEQKDYKTFINGLTSEAGFAKMFFPFVAH